MRRWAQHRDTSEPGIIKALEAVGASVTQLNGHRVPDLLVGYRGRTYLLECKTPGARKTGNNGKRNAGQEAWRAEWRGGPVAVVETPEDAVEVIQGRAEVSEEYEAEARVETLGHPIQAQADRLSAALDELTPEQREWWKSKVGAPPPTPEEEKRLLERLSSASEGFKNLSGQSVPAGAPTLPPPRRRRG